MRASARASEPIPIPMTAPNSIAAADWAAACLAIDPALGGIVLRLRASPAREDWLAAIAPYFPNPPRRLQVAAAEDRVFGGLDLAATLAAGRPVHHSGLIYADQATFILPMAERMTPGFAARLVAARADGGQARLILLDETAEDEDTAPPTALTDGLAFQVSQISSSWPAFDPETIAAACTALAQIETPSDLAEHMVIAAAALGIDSLRAPLLALRCARAVAALAGDKKVSDDAARIAATLVLSHRATQLPQTEDPTDPEPESTPPDPPPESDNQENSDTAQDRTKPPSEILLEAAAAQIPPDLLARLQAQGSLSKGQSAGAGEDMRGKARGRPAGTRRGDPRSGARLDLISTLRAAAPWQPLRQRMTGTTDRVIVTSDDLRIRQFRQRTERVVIFCVDASGSAAMTRLAETKGAIELMLAEAYVRREQVALIAFRGETAEVLLPPTRSLVQAKRRLAALPGGGGTPLASGLETALSLADQIRRRGQTAHLAMLTDGRANIARDGSPGRQQAAEDARDLARLVRAAGLPVLLIDTAPRPQQTARELADTMGGTYLPMPRADAHRINSAMRAGLDRAG